MLGYMLSKCRIGCSKLLHKGLDKGRILLYELTNLLESRRVTELLEFRRDWAASKTAAAPATTASRYPSRLRSLRGCLEEYKFKREFETCVNKYSQKDSAEQDECLVLRGQVLAAQAQAQRQEQARG